MFINEITGEILDLGEFADEACGMGFDDPSYMADFLDVFSIADAAALLNAFEELLDG